MTPAPGVNYYQLKMVDGSGSTEYSKVVSAGVQTRELSAVNLFLNPADNLITILAGMAGSSAVATVTDVTGKEVAYCSFQDGKAVLSTVAFPVRQYFIRYTNGERIETVRFIKR